MGDNTVTISFQATGNALETMANLQQASLQFLDSMKEFHEGRIENEGIPEAMRDIANVMAYNQFIRIMAIASLGLVTKVEMFQACSEAMEQVLQEQIKVDPDIAQHLS